MKNLMVRAVGLGVAVLCGGASASVIDFTSDDAAIVGSSGVSFTGTSAWISGGGGGGGGLGVLHITITNTTGGDVGGYLTGFAFNLGGFEASVAMQSTDALNFVGVTSVSAEPFGKDYAAGAAVGGSWLGGGRPQGLAPGETGSFTFDVVSSFAAQFSAATPFDGPFEYDFVVRFRGLSDGGSSKVPGRILPEVPAPGGAALMGAALFVGLGRRRARPAP